ncbi:unnamed protein product [Rotaria sp. Silwood1]|nr:unnamed protein product [Rotaria sp. Silwood1]CAF1578797.1 unnamed protein product [Rotaria sp. Silwood1]CAF3708056.1 unnamed protein product [Rotaria sp. Silwood1]CAF4856423.1 unnamed protein product [Rotaria sp. Silwood1]
MAAYRKVMMNNENYGSFYSRSLCERGKKTALTVVSPSVLLSGLLNSVFKKKLSKNSAGSRIQKIEEKRRTDIHEYLLDLQANLPEINQKIKKSFQKWLKKNQKVFISKVNSYHSFAVQTLDQPYVAYKLAREFAPLFAQIECCLVSNLDLAQHYGQPLTIERDTALDTCGFFTIYPASWDSEQNLVVKELKNPSHDRNIAYLETHFHRTVTHLQIQHLVPLIYLYETVKDPQQFAIVLKRYSKSLYSYLMDHINEVTIGKAIQIALDIAQVIVHMHAYELVHCDVKVKNILLDTNDQVFLADFGTCQHGTENSTFIGSRPFAPEITQSDRQYSYQGAAVDVSCLGVLMYVVAPKDVFHEPQTLTEIDINTLD